MKKMTKSLCLLVGAMSVSIAFNLHAKPQVDIAEQPLTIERIYSSPSLQGKSVKALQFSPDGSRVTYLQGKASDHQRYDLWEYNLEANTNRLLVDSDDIFAGKEELSDEEKARRERQRVYGSGIMEYTFSKDGSALLFPVNGDIYYYDLAAKKARRITESEAFETDIKFSPKGRYISFIREQNLFVYDLQNNKETQLTNDGGGLIKNGMSEFVAQEEMDRMTGYWWADDEANIAYLRVDESPVDAVIRNEIYAEEVKLIEQRYPSTGTNNVKIELATVNLKNKKSKVIPLGSETDIYLPRVKWLPSGKTLSYQWQNRSQQELKLRTVDIRSNKQKTLITEQSDHWINLHKDLHFLKDGTFIWASERDGFKHLYRFDEKGTLIAQLTKGNWVVDKLHYVDEENGWVYFSGRADTPLEKHLYKVTLGGKSPEHATRITTRNGTHNITFAKNGSGYLDNFSNITTPPQVSLHSVQGKHITWLEENKLTNEHPVAPYYRDLIQPKFGTIEASDEQTELFYKLYKPKNLVPGKKYPVIVKVYGGPHAQRVTNRWEGADLTQYFIDQGFIVFQLDNRGSNYRGTAFEFPIYEHLGKVELEDQISGVEYLRTLPFVDPKRIGIYGHSYGGYMALMGMFKAGDYFAAGVSGAPVTDWLLYDTHYTERYLNHPAKNADGYEASSVFPYAKDLSGDLLIYHGMADDNVLFTNTTKLIKVLQDENKHFDLMTYPGSKHSMRGKKVKVHLNHTIVNFFNRHLNDK